MRKLLLIVLSLVLLSGSCRKPKSKTPVEQLPAETQNGANTFGCLIDGKAFIPKGDPFGGPIKKAQYQFVDGKQSFGISGSRSDGQTVQTIGIFGDSVVINAGTYELTSRSKLGKLHGRFLFSQTGTLGDRYYTNEIHKGQITVKHFDQVNQIVSGTFWFDAVDSTSGKIVQIREGRFDMPYVK